MRSMMRVNTNIVENYLQEFPDYDDTLPMIDGFVDSSWHNDVCPSICEKDNTDEDTCLYIFIDYKNPSLRECVNDHRYTLSLGYGTGDYLFSTDNWDEMVGVVKYHISMRKLENQS